VNVRFWVNVTWAFFCGGDCRVSVDCKVDVVSFIMYGHYGMTFLPRPGMESVKVIINWLENNVR
jgi:hypothetical protein